MAKTLGRAKRHNYSLGNLPAFGTTTATHGAPRRPPKVPLHRNHTSDLSTFAYQMHQVLVRQGPADFDFIEGRHRRDHDVADSLLDPGVPDRKIEREDHPVRGLLWFGTRPLVTHLNTTICLFINRFEMVYSKKSFLTAREPLCDASALAHRPVHVNRQRVAAFKRQKLPNA